MLSKLKSCNFFLELFLFMLIKFKKKLLTFLFLNFHFTINKDKIENLIMLQSILSINQISFYSTLFFPFL